MLARAGGIEKVSGSESAHVSWGGGIEKDIRQ